jgi:hypothetical protein
VFFVVFPFIILTAFYIWNEVSSWFHTMFGPEPIWMRILIGIFVLFSLLLITFPLWLS